MGIPFQPRVTDLHIGALNGRPSDAMCRLLLARIAHMGRECMVESFAINILRVRGEVLLN